MNKKRKIKLFFLLLLLFLLGACFVFTQAKELEIEYPGLPSGVEVPTTTETAFPVYVRYIFNLAIMIAGVVAFGALVFGGIRYLTSSGSPSTKQDASGQIAAGFFSLIILLSSYLILFTIDPKLVIFNLPDIEKIPSPKIESLPPEKVVFNFKEIPTGYLIERALEKEKLNKIDNFSKKLLEKVDELKKLAEELEALTKKCQCGRTASVNGSGNSCQSCTYGQPCPCTACQGEFGSNHDPCPNRGQIEGKKKEILKKVDEIKEVKDKLEEQRQILIKDLINLEKAEKLMQECFGQAISYNNLISLKNIIDNIEIEKLDEWKNFTVPADEATFYCQDKTNFYQLSE